MIEHKPLPPILEQAMRIYVARPRSGWLQWRINSDHMTALEATQPPRDPDEPIAPAYVLCGFPVVVDDSVTEMTLEAR